MMKKISTVLLCALCATYVFAGGIDNKTNLSTGFIRNPSRNVESERPEAVFYNIAGTGMMEDGLYFEVGNQFLIKNYSNQAEGIPGMDDKIYNDKEPVLFYPNFSVVWKNNRFAVFGGFNVFGGGGSLAYKDGTAATAGALLRAASAPGTIPQVAAILAGAAKNHALSVYGVTFGEIFGLSYNFWHDRISISAAGRLLHGTQRLTLSSSAAGFDTLNGGKEAGFEAFGTGFGAIFGIHFRPYDILDLSVQYQTKTKMQMRFKSTKGNLIGNFINGRGKGGHFQNDMPAVLNLGVGYRAINPLYISFSFNYYFNDKASIEDIATGKNLEYKNSYEFAVGFDYQIIPQVLASIGAAYSNQGFTDNANSVFSPVLNSITVGGGAEITPIPESDLLKITLGFSYTHYFEETYTNINLNKRVFDIGIGATVKLFGKKTAKTQTPINVLP